MTPIRAPRPNQASYKAAELILRRGVLSERDLFAAVDFGARAGNRHAALNRAIDSGWLVRVDDLIGVSSFAREHLANKPKEVYIGKKAEPRSINLMNRKPYVPPTRIPRADEPEWSKRVGVTFYTVK
jgi:hypothetical protein